MKNTSCVPMKYLFLFAEALGREWGLEQGGGGLVMAQIVSGEGIDGYPEDYRKEEKVVTSRISQVAVTNVTGKTD